MSETARDVGDIQAGRPGARSALGRAVRAVGWGSAHTFGILALVVAWEAFARSGAVTMFILPPFSAVLERIREDAIHGDLWLNTSLTIYRAFAGFALGGVVGLLIGIAIWHNRVARWFFDPIISVGFPMPKVAFLPVVILWFGVFDMSKISMVTIEVVFPVVTATVIGFQGVGHELIWSARNMGARSGEVLWQVMLPGALPQIFTGFQVALPIALIVAIFAEMAMSGYGLGGAMMQASRHADSRGVFAGIVEIAVVGYCVVKLMSYVRYRLLIWHPEALAPSTV
jgi:ABC-type nitrate/sulfonate/bicarbonate transport system permease component